MIFFNRKLTAQQVCDRGLVTEVFLDDVFEQEVQTRLNAMAKLPQKVTSIHI